VFSKESTKYFLSLSDQFTNFVPPPLVIYHDAKRHSPQNGTSKPIRTYGGLQADDTFAVQPQVIENSMQMVPITSSKENVYPNAALPWFSLLPPGLIKSAYGEKTLEAFMNLYVPPGEMRTIHGEQTPGYDVGVYFGTLGWSVVLAPD
jgi:hypothetical protein